MTVVIGIASDEHCRSTVGLIHPNGVPLSDEGHYTPSKGQRWLWDCWLEGWDMVGELAAKHNAPVWFVNNGDLVDGDHHNTFQIVSRDGVPEGEVVRDVLNVPLDLSPERTFIVKGTSSHTGPGSSSEERIARALSDSYKVEQDGGNYSWYKLMMDVEGVLIDFTHHGRTGYRPWTQWNATALLAAQITMERVRSGDPLPALCIRSHFHRHSDSYDAQPVRVIQTPAFQLATEYVHAKVPESLADIGMIAVVVDDGHFEIHKNLHVPSRGTIWKA